MKREGTEEIGGERKKLHTLVEYDVSNPAAEIEQAKNRINTILSVEIPKVEQQVGEVDKQIREVEQKIENKDDVDFNKQNLSFLRRDKDQLRQELAQIREELAIVRRKEEQLREELARKEEFWEKSRVASLETARLQKLVLKLKDPLPELTPLFYIGQLVLPRQSLIEKYCEELLNDHRPYINHYWRGPRGSGKTTFLYLLGTALQQRDCDVYYMEHAGSLNDYKEAEFTALFNKTKERGRRFVMMIDEAHHDISTPLWVCLLRKLRGAIILGVGVPELGLNSPYFQNKHDATELFLNDDDISSLARQLYHLEECNATLQELGVSVEDVEQMCHWVSDYTNGHMYPTLKICEHFVLEKPDKIKDVGAFEEYCTSYTFNSLPLHDDIVCRCFNFGLCDLNNLREELIRMKNISMLDRFGLWDRKHWRVSPYVIQYLLKSKFVTITSNIDVTSISNPVERAKLIILEGLKDMQEINFFEHQHGGEWVKYEDGIGILWAINVRKNQPNLFISPQTQVHSRANLTGKAPCIDFTFDGDQPLAIELVRDGNSSDLVEHYNRFLPGGKYSHWKNFAVLNFQTRKSGLPPHPENENYPHLYTFVTQKNALYNSNNRDPIARAVANMPTPH